MQTLKTRCWELAAVLALATVACSPHLTVTPSVGPLGASLPARAACATHRVATVRNPTTGDVNVFVTRRVQGYPTIAKLGTVNAGTTGEFDLATEDENRLQFEWAQGGAGLDSHELAQVRYKIRCENQR
jgi:hypothetical protein